MTRPTVEFIRFLAGLRQANTTLTSAEQRLLRGLAAGCRCVVEVGVYEGATSAVLASAMAADGNLWLVDPFIPHTRPERLLSLSYCQVIANRSVARWKDRVRFVRDWSSSAAGSIRMDRPAELIFIDADHSYDAVRQDFIAWRQRLAAGGALAFHDSRMCDARPDLTPEEGPVRLMGEIERGDHGPWVLEARGADSITVVRSAPTTS